MEQVFEDLFKSNYKRFVSVSFAYTKQKELAEEVVQDVFVDFWKRLQKEEKILNHEAYLRRAIVYRSLDVIKKEKKYMQKESIDLLENALPHSDLNPESNIISKEKLTFLQKQIMVLPDRTREVFMLSRFEKMTYKEIADHLDIKEKTVEYHISNALSKLKKLVITVALITFSIFI